MWRILWTIFFMKITKKYSLKSKAMRKTPVFRFSVFWKKLRKANKCRTTITKKIPKFQKLKISLTRCENIQNITTLSLKKMINTSADRNYEETLSFWEQNVVLRKTSTLCFRDLAICQWWFDFKLEPIFDTAPAASTNKACFKSGQSWLKNNQLAT